MLKNIVTGVTLTDELKEEMCKSAAPLSIFRSHCSFRGLFLLQNSLKCANNVKILPFFTHCGPQVAKNKQTDQNSQ